MRIKLVDIDMLSLQNGNCIQIYVCSDYLYKYIRA